MTHFKKNLLITILAMTCSSSLFAANAANPTQNSESLQQQLQSLQESLQSPAKVTKAPGVTTTRTSTITTQSSSVATQLKPAGEKKASSAELPAPELPTPVATTATVNENASNLAAPATANEAASSENNPVVEQDLRTEAFGKVVNTVLPLSPSQIRMLRNMHDATQKAVATYPGVPPRPTASSLRVNLAPGATPPVVRLGAGFVTSLVFVDSTGAPWPIDSYSLGNPTAFNIVWDKKSNILLIQAITAHRMGNLAVILKGLNTPVMVELSPGQAALDVRLDLRIPGLGPQAKPVFDTLPGTESPALLALLDGIPPPGARNLKCSACENCAWLIDGKLYLRTQFTVLSPAWISTISSADGTHVYEMQLTPLVLASYNGKTIKMRIEGF